MMDFILLKEMKDRNILPFINLFEYELSDI